MPQKSTGKNQAQRHTSPPPPKAAEPKSATALAEKTPAASASIVEKPVMREVLATAVASQPLSIKPEANGAATAVATAPAKIEPAAAASPVVAAAPSIAATAKASPSAESIEKDHSSAIAALTLSLHDSDADIARDAATALGSLRDPRAVEPLLGVLNDDKGYFHAVVRAAAAASLGQLGDARAVSVLLNAINDPQAECSAEAIRALASIGDSRAVGELIDVVQNPSGFFLPIARRAAVLALGRFKDEQAVQTLNAVASDAWEDATIRQDASEALRQASPQGKAD